MALYAPTYRVGYAGHFAYKAQEAALVGPTVIADPSAVASVTTLLGYSRLPGWTQNENYQPLESIGSMRGLGKIPGRRECSINTSILVSDATFFPFCIRDHSDPDKTGTVNGLPLMTYEFGTPTDYGAQAWSKQGLDGLVNSFGFDFAENQPLTANLDIWPTAFIAGAGQAAAVPATPVLHWVNSTFIVGSTDYQSIIERVSFRANNGLIRQGCRAQMGADGSELAISRTPFAILPGVESLQVSYSFKDALPASLLTSADWGTTTLRAEQPGTGAGRVFAQVAIAHQYLNRFGGQQGQPRQPITWTGDTLAYAVTVTGGLTSA
jgi:hypothetical protein